MSALVHVRNPDASLYGELDVYWKLDMIKRFRDVGSWSIQMGASSKAQKLATTGYGLRLLRDNVPFLSGRTMVIEKQFDNQGNLTLVASGVSDLARIDDLTAWPAAAPFTAAAHDSRTGNGESVIKGFVSYNAGNSARLPSSAVPLTVAANLGRGGTIAESARFQNLLELIQGCGLTSGLGFDVIDFEFDVYAPQNRTAQQVFSVNSGNLFGYNAKITAPSVTRVVAAGGNEGVSRIFQIVEDNVLAEAWGFHIEQFTDARDTTDTAVLTQRANEALLKGAAKTELTLAPIDVPNRKFGVDWDLGDRVTAEGIPGTVSEVHLTIDANGDTIIPTVDSSGMARAAAILAAFDEIRALRKQIQDLQRSQ